MVDTKAMIQAIRDGDFDGHELEIVAAVRKRVEQGWVKAGWKLTYDGLEVKEEDLTIAESQIIDRMVDDPRDRFPAPASSPLAIVAHHVAILVHRANYTEEEARKKVEAEPTKSLLGNLSDYTIVDPPKESGSQSKP